MKQKENHTFFQLVIFQVIPNRTSHVEHFFIMTRFFPRFDPVDPVHRPLRFYGRLLQSFASSDDKWNSPPAIIVDAKYQLGKRGTVLGLLAVLLYDRIVLAKKKHSRTSKEKGVHCNLEFSKSIMIALNEICKWPLTIYSQLSCSHSLE